MIKSMTGFGKGEGGGFSVEMRSVNHKFLDLSFKLPKGVLPLESRLKKTISGKFARGRIDVYVTRCAGEESLRGLKLNSDAARQYIGLLSELKTTFDLPGEIDLNLLTSFGDIITAQEVSEDIESAWTQLEAALLLSIEALDRMRVEEGEALAADVRERTIKIAANLDDVERRAPVVIGEYSVRLKERVEKLSASIELDGDRLIQEVALFAERSDITEEIVRARSHLTQFGRMLEEGGPAGRKFDFLIQEINREINTIGSKASDYHIAQKVVEMKSELEKVREQVQNIE
ncbi:MAG: YicC/YloC family endoribonuclease [Nitrospirota bacterium]